MVEELLLFVEKFVARMKRQKRAFSVSDIERAFNKQRKKENKMSVQLTNMQRLIVVSRLLKGKSLQRTYKKAGHDNSVEPVFF